MLPLRQLLGERSGIFHMLGNGYAEVFQRFSVLFCTHSKVFFLIWNL